MELDNNLLTISNLGECEQCNMSNIYVFIKNNALTNSLQKLCINCSDKQTNINMEYYEQQLDGIYNHY